MPEVSGREPMRGMGVLHWRAGVAEGLDLVSGKRTLACWVEWAQVAERLMAADCKSAAPWSYGGSNPPLCTTDVRGWIGRRFTAR